MTGDNVKKFFPELTVIKVFPASGQKFVFLVEHPVYGAIILKIIKNMNDRIVREIDIATKHEILNIPKIHEVNSRNIDGTEYTYFYEQYIDGDTLRNEMFTSPFSLRRSIDLLSSLLIIAVELEKAHIVHRDIKPDNILCCKDWSFFLIDFGIARMLDSPSLTMTEAAVGPHTPGYGAPELFQYSKNAIDIKADLFSIGVVVYESIFNRHPFVTGDELNINEIWYKTATVIPRDFSIDGDTDRKLMGFLQTLMQKHISRRPPTAQKALEWLEIVKDSINVGR